MTAASRPTAQEAVAHLTPARWARANRLLLRKALAEFAHERLLTPKRLPPDGHYSLHSDDGSTEYRFAARRQALDHWQIDADSITRHRGHTELPLDAPEFILELRDSLGLGADVLPVYLEEISSTLSGTAYKLAAQQPTAAELALAGFQAVETGMTEGHPCFVANNGRLGFGIHEYHAYAPETASPLQLIWLAARRDHATFTAGEGLDYDTLIRSELPRHTRDRFTATLTGLGLDPDDYYLFPTHPWQWWNKLSVTFAAEVAQQHLVCLGPGDDTYLAQQSLRTFFNTTTPAAHYVKTALSVLNMGFMRGLSAAYMEATPAINDWLARLIDADDTFRAAGFSIIRERAAIGYHHRQYEAATAKGSPYRKMLAALWRESPVAGLEPGRRLATMASLLHTDDQGGSFAAALIKESGLAPADWLRRYLDAYLTPVLHAFYAYDLVFMPHGENAILVLEDGAVARVIFKDIAEEIAVMVPQGLKGQGGGAPSGSWGSAPITAVLPPAVERIRAEVPEDKKLLSVFTDVFDCFFRFLSGLLDDRGVLDEDTFWRTVAECVLDYQASAPHLADKFARYDMFAEEFALSCLNRLQLRNNQEMVDLQDPAGALQLIGTLRNPLAPYAPAA
ncbi:IucA/IucC family protein [Streptomyces sioyaensis]|uniref:IucA/IucC family protein n=1 Tax=Streptomyces sioyaensis TaxID=67364 RepID=UPI00371A4959